MFGSHIVLQNFRFPQRFQGHISGRYSPPATSHSLRHNSSHGRHVISRLGVPLAEMLRYLTSQFIVSLDFFLCFVFLIMIWFHIFVGTHTLQTYNIVYKIYFLILIQHETVSVFLSLSISLSLSLSLSPAGYDVIRIRLRSSTELSGGSLCV